MKSIKVILYISLVCILLAGAFYVPEIITTLQDKRTLGQVNTQMVELNTYKLSYQSFAEKLHAIGLAASEGMVVDTIQLIEDSSAVSNEELTELAMQEVDALLNERLGMNLSVSLEALKSRELYTVFGRSLWGSENLLSGIQFYKLTYNLADYYGYDYMVLELYMDTEFHKLYAFRVDTMESNISPVDGFFVTEEAKSALVEVEEEMTYALLDYWDITENYSICIESGDYGNWGKNEKNGGAISWDYVIFEEDLAQLSTIWEIYWELECWYVRGGIIFE